MTNKLGLPSSATSATSPSISPITSPFSLPPSWIDYDYNGRYYGSYDSHTKHVTRDVEKCQSLCLADSACNAVGVGHDCMLYMGCVMTKDGKTQNWVFTYYFLMPPSWIDYCYSWGYYDSYKSYTRHVTRYVETCQSLCLANSACHAVGLGHDCVSYMGCLMTKEGKTQNWGFTYYFMTRKLGLPSSATSATFPSISPITSPSSLAPSLIDYDYNGRYCGSYDLHTRHVTRDVETCQSLCLADSSCNAVGVGHDCMLYMGCVMTKEGNTQSWDFIYYFLMPLSWIDYCYNGRYYGSYDSHTWHETKDVETYQSLCLADLACHAVGVNHDCMLYMGCVMTKEGQKQNWGFTYYFLPQPHHILGRRNERGISLTAALVGKT